MMTHVLSMRQSVQVQDELFRVEKKISARFQEKKFKDQIYRINDPGPIDPDLLDPDLLDPDLLDPDPAKSRSMLKVD